jgi:hypothetical protein
MQCENFESRLNQILDRRARPETDEMLLAHAATCEPCRELLAVGELLFDGVDLLETPEISPGFARRVVDKLAPRHRTSSFAPGRWLGPAAAVAALLVVAVISGRHLWWPSGRMVASPGSGQPTKSISTAPGTLAVTSPPTKRVAPSASQRPSVTRPAAVIAEPTNDDYRELLETLAHRLPDVPRDSLESVEQIPDGLRPIATSFNVAIGLLRRTLPGGKDEPAAPPKPQASSPFVYSTERLA